jgi:hypothetical protein
MVQQARKPDDLGGWGPKAWDQLRADVDWVIGVMRARMEKGPPWFLILSGCIVPIVIAVIATSPWK